MDQAGCQLSGHQFFPDQRGKFIINGGMNISAFIAGAHLPGIGETGKNSRFSRFFQICIFHYNEGCLTPQFQTNFLEGIGRCGHDLFAGGCAAGHGDQFYIRVFDQWGTNVFTIACHHIQHPSRNTGFLCQTCGFQRS